MTAQFWWGLAMLPLGAVGLALAVGLPCWALWTAERYRKSRAFFLRESGPAGPVALAALVALSNWGRQISLPLYFRITISRDAPGSTPTKVAANARYQAIQDALRTQAEKEKRP